MPAPNIAIMSTPGTARRLRPRSLSSPPIVLVPRTPTFWLNWTKFDYLYVLFTEDEAPNPDPARLKLIADGDRFQLYRIIKPGDQARLEQKVAPSRR